MATSVLTKLGRLNEDTSAVVRLRLATEEADKRLLTEELRRLREQAEAQPPALGPLRPGCLELADSSIGGAGGALELLAAFQRDAPVGGLAMNSQGLVAAAAWDGTVQLFNLPDWTDLGELHCGNATSSTAPAPVAPTSPAYTAAAFMPEYPDFLGLLTGQEAQLWQLLPGGRPARKAATITHTAWLSDLDFHQTQSVLATASDDGVAALWDVPTQQTLRRLRGGSMELTGCRFLCGETYEFVLATTSLDGSVHLLDIRQGRELNHTGRAEAATCLACDGSNHLLAVGFADAHVSVLDMRNWQELRRVSLCKHSPHARPRSVALSACNRALAVGCLDGELCVADLRLPQNVQVNHHYEGISALTWSKPISWAPLDEASCLVCASWEGAWTCWQYSR